MPERRKTSGEKFQPDLNYLEEASDKIFKLITHERDHTSYEKYVETVMALQAVALGLMTHAFEGNAVRALLEVHHILNWVSKETPPSLERLQ